MRQVTKNLKPVMEKKKINFEHTQKSLIKFRYKWIKNDKRTLKRNAKKNRFICLKDLNRKI